MTASLGQIFDRLVTACATVAGVMLVCQLVSVSLDVLVRYLFNFTIDGVTAFTEWSLVYIAFLGAAWLQREKGHVQVDMLIMLLPAHLGRILMIFGLLVGLGVTAVLVAFGTTVTWIKFAEMEYDFFKIPWVPLWTIFVVIPFGSALWFLQLCRDIHALWHQHGHQ